ncbi:hypothetical protein GE061_004633 [Apolygus lucorum]|uniref:Transcription factor 25 n=1 Tax=Apolygus lucorum TaxID=248454 RepID=A0A8S9X3R3_APOLU|nr:hypothetical protein GE061_004633 [Apolygus lucorum]
MSSRVLRKLGLQGEKDLNCLGNDESDTEADFSSSSNSKKKQLNLNRYDLLNQQSHSESEVKEDDNETAGSLNAQDGAIDLRDASRRKKKKKKKKSCKVPSSNTRSSEDNIEDEVERSVREVNEILGEMEEAEASNLADAPAPLARKCFLTIDHRALNKNNELRRIFGSKIVQNEQTKKRGRSRGTIRSTVLVSPKDNWPQIGKPGISMRLVETKNGVQYFSYEHSLNYQQIQMRFLDAVESLNPDYIVGIINTHPYHVDALLQLSDLCRLSDDLSMAAEFIQRALYCLECAFHPSFIISSGRCRLDYRKQENRSLYISLFKHMMSIGSRACYRTALEFSKLILSLDPDGDPLAIILAMDFYALRAQEYDWLLKMFHECEPTRNLSQLPNFAYSLAVAHFQLGDVEAAHAQLQKALIQFPGVLLALTEKCSVQVDSRILNSPFFRDATDKQSKSLTQLEVLYVARCYHVWKESELLPWLEHNVHRVLDRVEANDPLVEEWGKHRQTRYPATPRNILRHIILSDVKDIPILTSEELPAPMFNFDPLPPSDSINLYTRPTTRAYEENGTLVIFLRSLMPNYNMNQLVSDEAGDEPAEGAGGAGGSGVDLRRSVASLLDAMRDLTIPILMTTLELLQYDLGS